MHSSTLQRSGYAPVNGIRMYYEIHGPAGQLPLVLLHGGGDTIETSFEHLLPVLARSRRIIAFEQQGCGRTADIEDRPFSFEQSADDTAALPPQPAPATPRCRGPTRHGRGARVRGAQRGWWRCGATRQQESAPSRQDKSAPPAATRAAHAPTLRRQSAHVTRHRPAILQPQSVGPSGRVSRIRPTEIGDTPDSFCMLRRPTSS